MSILDNKLKAVRLSKSSKEFQYNYKLKTLDSVLDDLDKNKNRYIFYCPDIILVNSLVKLIYETAYEAHKAGYQVVILHEMNGFKCNWLVKDKDYKHLSELNVDYIITKKGNKTTRTDNKYAFKPGDTLIIPDQFVEMLENLIDVKILQKVLFITSYAGLSALQPGMDFKSLGIDKVIFSDKKLALDYSTLFDNMDLLFLDNYPINKDLFKTRDDKKVLPLITISHIGNNDFVQQVINIFFNKYPNLRVFNFRLLDRNNLPIYVENLEKAAACLVLDKNLNSLQMINEAMAMGCPVLTTKRQEMDVEFLKHIWIGDTPFEVADGLAEYCEGWLTNLTTDITNTVVSLNEIGTKTYENFHLQVLEAIESLKENRQQFFDKVQKSLKVNE